MATARQSARTRCLQQELALVEMAAATRMEELSAKVAAAEAVRDATIRRAAVERRLLSTELAKSERRVVRLCYRLEDQMSRTQHFQRVAAQHLATARQVVEVAHRKGELRQQSASPLMTPSPPPPPPSWVRPPVAQPLNGADESLLPELRPQRPAPALPAARIHPPLPQPAWVVPSVTPCQPPLAAAAAPYAPPPLMPTEQNQRELEAASARYELKAARLRAEEERAILAAERASHALFSTQLQQQYASPLTRLYCCSALTTAPLLPCLHFYRCPTLTMPPLVLLLHHFRSTERAPSPRPLAACRSCSSVTPLASSSPTASARTSALCLRLSRPPVSHSQVRLGACRASAAASDPRQRAGPRRETARSRLVVSESRGQPTRR